MICGILLSGIEPEMNDTGKPSTCIDDDCAEERVVSYTQRSPVVVTIIWRCACCRNTPRRTRRGSHDVIIPIKKCVQVGRVNLCTDVDNSGEICTACGHIFIHTMRICAQRAQKGGEKLGEPPEMMGEHEEIPPRVWMAR